MSSKFYSIGYQNRTKEEFLTELITHKVDLLVDVRDYPNSRKKGFAKSQLQNILDEVGVEYRHFKRLGAPKPLRHAVKNGDIAYDEFHRLYRRYLDDQSEALQTLASLAEHHVVCIMCYEDEYSKCHRADVSDRMASVARLKLVHL